MNAIQNRSGSVDLTKTIAILSVLTIHAFAACFRSQVGTWDWYGGLFLSSAVRTAVPLFFMCTGALMLRPERDLPFRRLFAKYIPRLLIALFFWAFVYKCYDLWETGRLNGPELWHAFKSLFFFQHETHLYYLHICLLIYALLPVLRIVIAAATRNRLRYALLIWFLTAIVYPTLRPFWPLNRLTGIPVQWMLNMTWGSLGYVLLGYYLTVWTPKLRLSWGMTGLGLAATYALTVLFSLKTGSLEVRFFEGMSINVCLYAAGIFSLCRHAKPKTLRPVFEHVSQASFCVYLCHMLILRRLKLAGFMNLTDTAVLMIPLALGTLLVCSLCVHWVLSKLPVIRKWLI